MLKTQTNNNDGDNNNIINDAKNERESKIKCKQKSENTKCIIF